MFLAPIPYWVAFVIGFAAVTERIGSRFGLANPLGARLSGAGVLIALMLIPIVGLFVMVPVIFCPRAICYWAKNPKTKDRKQPIPTRAC
jgi:hypothetical protein